MIGDEKLGQRGVKVRCKKCSYVIILRPPGYAAGSKKGQAPITADVDETELKTSLPEERSGPLPEDAFAPTTPFAGQPSSAADIGTPAARSLSVLLVYVFDVGVGHTGGEATPEIPSG